MAETNKKFNKQDYDNKYIKEKYDRINFLMPKGTKERIKEAAQVRGVTPSEFIRTCLEQELDRTPMLKKASE
jgi:predicted DNA binding CopG/RHH family protein